MANASSGAIAPLQNGSASRWLPLAVAVLLLFAVSITLAKLTWRAAPAVLPLPKLAAADTPRATATSARQTKPAANATTQRGPNPKALANYHLFGKADAPVKAVKAPVEKKIKQTNLKLTLKGTMARSDPKGGIAMISAERGKEKAYLVGESVAEVADLYEVYFDRVILKRGDALEELLLTRVKASNGRNSRSGTTNRRTNTRNATVSKATGRTTPAVTTGGKPDYRKIREELINNPEKVTDYIRVQPVQKDGKISGYRIYPGRNRDLFRKAGLRSGDLITAVNGQTLEDPNQGIAILAALTTAERIDLNIKRRGRDRQIVVDLNE